jgi:demethylmenaquinone methyltransferase / 2-methoxy-6-polyprenyl-1,4-benzoquinol methylase
LFGLGYQYWREVTKVLRSIIHVYDKVNIAISLGRANIYRVKGIKGKICPGSIILDAGSGYGNMSKIAAKFTQGWLRTILYDPIPEMLSNTRNFLPLCIDQSLSSGVFEYMPFKNNVFDAVCCGYSLRDAIELDRAVAEIYRVLKIGGTLIIVDLGKPDNMILKFLVSFYLKYILAIIAFCVAGQVGLKFKALHGTFQKWPTNSQLYTLLSTRFVKVKFQTALMGAAIIVAAYKQGDK